MHSVFDFTLKLCGR